jgi:hypothetical protein
LTTINLLLVNVVRSNVNCKLVSDFLNAFLQKIRN